MLHKPVDKILWGEDGKFVGVQSGEEVRSSEEMGWRGKGGGGVWKWGLGVASIFWGWGFVGNSLDSWCLISPFRLMAVLKTELRKVAGFPFPL